MAEAARDSRSSPTASRRRLNAELDNVRRALDWFVERGDAEAALSLSVGTGWLFFTRAEFQEGARWVADALGRARSSPPTGCAAWPTPGTATSAPSSRVRRPTWPSARPPPSALERDDDPELRADTLLLYASTLNRARRAQHRAGGAGAGAAAARASWGTRGGWACTASSSALTLENSGRLDEAERAARRQRPALRGGG